MTFDNNLYTTAICHDTNDDNNIVFLNADEGKDQILEISKGEVEQEED